MKVAGEAPPAAWCRFSAGRKVERPVDHLKTFEVWTRREGAAGFEGLCRSGRVREGWHPVNPTLSQRLSKS